MERALSSVGSNVNSFKRIVLASAFAAGALVAVACGDSGSTSDDDGTDGTCKEVKNGEFCAAESTGEVDCEVGQTHELCGVKMSAASAPLQRSSSVKEFKGTGDPKVSCYEPASYPPAPGMSQAVTVSGLVKIFSNGCESNNVKLTFYKVIRDGSANDGKLGEQVGESITTAMDCTVGGTAIENKNCPDDRYECTFSYANVPTDVELAVKTENGDGSVDWSPLVQYNVYVPSSEVVNGAYTKDFRAIDAGDYTLIATTSIGGPITSGNGAIGGEIHDCDDVRLINAVADIDQPRINKVAYFTSDEDKPLPKPGATQTEALGLYAILDVPPGQVRVAAAGMVGDEMVSLGEHKVFVYPNTVTSLTFRGMQPYQLPK